MNPENLIVRQIVDAYLEELRFRVSTDDCAARTLEDATRELANFTARFGPQKISDCRQLDLKEWLRGNPQWKSNFTKRRVLSNVLACFNWAADEEGGNLLKASPYRRPRKLRLPVKPRREATGDEYVALMRSGSRTLRRALFFLRRTGARPCEMRELLWEEVDWRQAVVLKKDHKTRRRTNRDRMFGLEPVVLRFLRNLHRQRRRGQTHVFVNSKGLPWTRSALCQRLRYWAKVLGLDVAKAEGVTAYCIRHSYTTWAIEAGNGERQVADQLGHVDTRMVAWYSKAHQKAAHLRNVATIAVRRPKGPR